jgi:hypothetical protein
MLMSHAGGQQGIATPVNLTFSDDATSPLPEHNLIVSGTYLPTDYLGSLPADMPPPAAEPYSTNLSTFIGGNANGAWSLLVYDSVQLDGGTNSSWSLDIEWRERTPLVLRNPRLLANGEFRADVYGETGIPTIIQRSSNLVMWLPVATNVYATSPGLFTDPPPAGRNRFYRAVQP